MEIPLGLVSLLIGAFVVAWVAARNREVASALWIGFLLRAAAALIDRTVYQLPGVWDGIVWDMVAAQWSRYGLEGTFEHIGTGHVFYQWLMSVLYALFDRSPLMIQGINVLLGTLIISAVWRLAKTLGDARSARTAAWFSALCPSLIYFSAVLLREVAVAYPLTLSVMYLASWHRERRTIYLVKAFAALLISMVFHSGGLAILLFAGIWFTGVWIRDVVTLNLRGLKRSTLGLVLGAALVATVLASGFGMQKFTGLEGGDMGLLTTRQENFATGRAAYLGDLHADSPFALVWQTPIRLVYFLFAPFPWMVSEASDVFGVIDSVLFFWLAVRALRRRKAVMASPAIGMVLGLFAAMAVVFAVGVSNYGTALRHRNKMLPLLAAATLAVPVAASGARKRVAPRVSIRPASSS